jgi:hypothetical protein
MNSQNTHCEGLLTTVKTSKNLEIVGFSAFYCMASQKLAKFDLEGQVFTE